MPCHSAKVDGTALVLVGAELLWYGTWSFLHVGSRSERECQARNDVISIAPILVRLSRILHNNGTATAVLAVPVPPPLDTVPPPQRLSYHIDLIGVKEPDRFLRITKEPHTSTVILYIAAKIVHVAQSGHHHRHYMSGLDWGHTAETGSQRFLKAVLVTGHSIYRTRLIGSRNIHLFSY